MDGCKCEKRQKRLFLAGFKVQTQCEDCKVDPEIAAKKARLEKVRLAKEKFDRKRLIETKARNEGHGIDEDVSTADSA